MGFLSHRVSYVRLIEKVFEKSVFINSDSIDGVNIDNMVVQGNVWQPKNGDIF